MRKLGFGVFFYPLMHTHIMGRCNSSLPFPSLWALLRSEMLVPAVGENA